MRYLPHTARDRKEMMDLLGVENIDELFEGIKSAKVSSINLPSHKSEIEVEKKIKSIADLNISLENTASFLGGGAYRHHIPASVDHLIQRSEFLTSYTPYQPEISQGTLQYLFEFQTQVSLLTGMDVANASMYDGASSCAEAVLMANRITKRNKILISSSLHPHYKECTETYLQFLDSEVSIVDDFNQDKLSVCYEGIDNLTSCVVIQNPCFFGEIRDLSDLAKKCKSVGALLIVVVTEIISLGAIKSPGEMGADIVVAEGQSLGNPLNFGGPYLGLFATRNKYLRQMPGRVVGETIDVEGKRGFVLTLSTREQHIRREKATSNICTNSGLCSLAFSIHLSLLGEVGFKKLAMLNHSIASNLANELKKITHVKLINKTFFNEFIIELPEKSEKIVEELISKSIIAGIPLSRLFPKKKSFENYLLIAATELNSNQDIKNFTQCLSEALK
ncbi:aminomethyl-transferring glycine dehydrogenase subunit GcvPA [Alphaproteobacteria bacterium]|nr:aminomethyl-transferring glycine dehydrogenase subunit GcvPA [Alphaproteobacteria bacterium]